MTEIIASQKELKIVIKEIDVLIQKGIKIFLLQGNLAAGKTTLVKEYAKHIGYTKDVNSPTFSLMNVYDEKICHFDLYNKELKNFLALGLLDELDKDLLHFIEWGDERLEEILETSGFDFCKIAIESIEGKRIYRIRECIN